MLHAREQLGTMIQWTNSQIARTLICKTWVEIELNRERFNLMIMRLKNLVCVWTYLLASIGVSQAAPKPNVIVILADDLGAVDLGCYGAQDMETPHLDALAGRGIRFTQFYSGAPVCSPSRAALLTGRYPVRCGVPSNAGSQRGDPAGLPPSEITMAETFKAAGYATALVGKWHLGYTPEKSPSAQGFGFSFGHMGGCIDNYSHFFYWSGPNIHDLHRNGQEVFHDGEYFPDLMVSEASQFLDKHRDQPCFMYFAMNMPHYPYQGDSKWLDRFQHVKYPRNLYNAFVAAQDERIGALLAKLDTLGLRENTIVVFQSDNGHSTEERAHFGGGSSGPYRGAKFSMFEGGLRLPAIISWPEKLPSGSVRKQIVHACDWLPTLATLCDIKLLNLDLDGADLGAVLRSEHAQSPHETLYWQVGLGAAAQWAVRSGPWKLIGSSRDTTDGRKPIDIKNFLANIDLDPGEKQDFADEHPEVVTRLHQLHQQWSARASAR